MIPGRAKLMRGASPQNRIVLKQTLSIHLDTLFTAAFHLTADQTRASALCEETALRAYRMFPYVAPGTPIRVWLLKILYGAFRQSFSRSQSEAPDAIAQRLNENTANANPPCSSFGTKPGLSRDFTELDASQLLHSLPEEYRAAILLIDVTELTYEEAGEVLELPIEAVRSRVSHGRFLLRSALKELRLRTPGCQDGPLGKKASPKLRSRTEQSCRR
jgi:RNA polymerase sigma-70 factor (ECF subfamily)